MREDINLHPKVKGYFLNCKQCGLPIKAPRNYTGDMCQCKMEE